MSQRLLARDWSKDFLLAVLRAVRSSSSGHAENFLRKLVEKSWLVPCHIVSVWDDMSAFLANYAACTVETVEISRVVEGVVIGEVNDDDVSRESILVDHVTELSGEPEERAVGMTMTRSRVVRHFEV